MFIENTTGDALATNILDDNYFEIASDRIFKTQKGLI